jgi:hypothetical protein
MVSSEPDPKLAARLTDPEAQTVDFVGKEDEERFQPIEHA